jgi:hypothetical protein
VTLIRHEGESQKAFVSRVLRRDGRISAHDATYDLRYDDGRPCGITRMAPVIEDLRKAGWAIDTVAPSGEQATYVLREQSEPAWRRGWRCQDCRSLPATEPVLLLGGLGQAHCATCGARRYFRRAA